LEAAGRSARSPRPVVFSCSSADMQPKGGISEGTVLVYGEAVTSPHDYWKETTMETEQATERSTKMSTDRIEKSVTLRAPRSRVWRAISNANEFGQWFGVTLDGAFTEGASVVGKIKDPRYAHFQMELLIERIQ